MPPSAGVGITFRLLSTGGFIVMKVSSGGPSDHKGVKNGDILKLVNGREVNHVTFENLAHLLSGPLGSSVSLTFSRRSMETHTHPDLQYTIDVQRGAAALSVGPAGSPHLVHESIALHQVARGRGQEVISGDERQNVMVNRTHGVDTENAGIGIVISNVNESHSAGAYHRIISVDPSGAAAQTGMIRVGDVIESLNGQDMWGKSLSEYTERLRGPWGTMVNIGILRSSAYTPDATHFHSPQSGAGVLSVQTEQINGKSHNGVGSMMDSPRISFEGRVKASEARGGRSEEMRRVVVSTVDQQLLARRIRIAHCRRLSGYTAVDAFLIWVIHSLVATAIVLFLVQIDVLPMNWDLRPFFQESRVHPSKVPDGGYFFVIAPLGILTAMFLLEMVLFAVTVYYMGVSRASLIFSQRPGLLCIMVYGNTFLGGSLLLLFFDLSRLDCCDFMHGVKYATMIIMAPVTFGVLLFWTWCLAMYIKSSNNPTQRQLRSEYFPPLSTFMWGLLSLTFVTGEIMIFLKVERKIENVRWLTACIPVHTFFGIIFLSSIVSFCHGPVWQNPTSRKVLALVGIIDSLVLEAITVIILLKLDLHDLEMWNFVPLVLAVAMPSLIFLMMTIHTISTICGSKKVPTTDVVWLQPTVLEFHHARATDKVSVKICWASPGSDDNFPWNVDFHVELSDVGAAKLVSDCGADLGVPLPADGYVAITQTWKQVAITQDQFVNVGDLEPSRRYLMRIKCASRDNRQDIVSTGPLILFETPDWPSAGLEDIILTTSPRPHHEASVAMHAHDPHPSAPPTLALPHEAVEPVPKTAGKIWHPVRQVSKNIHGPLFLKELTISGSGSQRLLCGLFEWLPQAHFDANILDLQLVEAGDSSKTHDYIMVFAGSEHQVRIHNLLPASSYHVRLRAGDFVDGQISTAVERATLPVTTPTWQEMLQASSRSDNEFGGIHPPPTVRAMTSSMQLMESPLLDWQPQTAITNSAARIPAESYLGPEEPDVSLVRPQDMVWRGTQRPHGRLARPLVIPASAYYSSAEVAQYQALT